MAFGLAILALGATFADGTPPSTEVEELWERAKQGHAEAQFALGAIYAMGVAGVARDATEAASWYRKAAEQGLPFAQSELGRMYFVGEGVEEDHAEAVSWCRKAADQGEVQAQYNLGFLYYLGAGVPKDDAEAASWFRKAADQGDPQSQFVLGSLYAIGAGVPRDEVRAYAWINVSAARSGDNPRVRTLEGDVRTTREELGASMTPAQVAEAQALSREMNDRIPRLEVDAIAAEALTSELGRVCR